MVSDPDVIHHARLHVSDVRREILDAHVWEAGEVRVLVAATYEPFNAEKTPGKTETPTKRI